MRGKMKKKSMILLYKRTQVAKTIEKICTATIAVVI